MNPPYHLPQSSRAFSVTELLVAITVTAILAAFGLAVLRPAQFQANRVQDVQNLKSIGQAFFLWMGEHNNRLPPVMGPTVPNYVHETLARQMGITHDLRDPTLTREQLGPWISPGDRRTPPSALRSYAVNYYIGAVHNNSSSQIVYRYHEIVDPSRTPYFMPSEGDSTNPNQQARFSNATWPFKADASSQFTPRFDNGTAPALMADGHVSLLSLSDLLGRPHLASPKQPKP